MRQLASIKEVSALYPIEGKDRIELAQIDGWRVIVKKGEFNVGSKCVYVEIDSVLPEVEQFEFLRNKNFRIKTMKMAGVVSQGICFPLDILPKKNYNIGEDVTDVLGIKQYEPTMDTERDAGDKKAVSPKYPKWLMRFKWFRQIAYKCDHREGKGFPSFISKTDETRIQNMPFILSDKRPFIVTEKVDGCVNGDSYINTDKGSIRIREIVKNKMPVNVLSYNEELNICEYKPIVDWHQIPASRKMFKIGVGFRGKGNRPKFIECTDNHKFFTNNGWKRADELTIDDVLMHYNKNIPYELKEIILGCLLGDSSLNSNSDTGNYRTVNFGHSIKQKDYFEYKKQLFGSYFIQEKDAVSGYGSTILRGKLVTNLNLLSIANDICSIGGKKTVTKEWADALTPISLAFWYMDDGSISNRENPNLRCRIQFNTQSFSIEEINILIEALRRKYNVNATIGGKDIYKGNIIIIDADNTEKLCSLIAPYVCQSMKYKLPKKYESTPCCFESVTFCGKDGVVQTPILSIEKMNKGEFRSPYVYDLEVLDNHNYFVKNILVHNCSGTWALVNKNGLFKPKYEYIVCSRNLRLYVKDNTSYWRVSERYDIENKLKEMIGDNEWIAIQGECVASNVQGNKYNVKEPDMYVFNVILPQGRMGSVEAAAFVTKHGMKFVPILDTEYVLPDTVNEMLDYAHGKSAIGDTLREGVVVRSKDGKTSFKSVSSEFLLHYDE